MADFITLTDLLSDKEVYEFLKSHYGDRLPPPPASEAEPEDKPAQDEQTSTSSEAEDNAASIVEPAACEPEATQDVSSRPTSPPEETIPGNPSPTFSFPSVSEDDAGPSVERDPVPTLVEDFDTIPATEPTKPAIHKTDTKPVCKAAIVNHFEHTTIRTADSTLPAMFDLVKSRTLTEVIRKGPVSANKPSKRKSVSPMPKPPPLYVLSIRKWIPILYWCYEREIKLDYVRRTSHGIKVIASTFDDLYNFAKLMVEKNVYFQAQREKRFFKARMKNVPKEITTEQIRQALLEDNIPVDEVYRTTCEVHALRDTHDMVIATIACGAAGKRIFKINPLRRLFNKIGESENEDSGDEAVTSNPVCNCNRGNLTGVTPNWTRYSPPQDQMKKCRYDNKYDGLTRVTFDDLAEDFAKISASAQDEDDDDTQKQVLQSEI